jgi:hypothetical protein
MNRLYVTPNEVQCPLFLCFVRGSRILRDMNKKLPPQVLAFFKKHGAAGGKIGGAIRAENMTAEERSEAARKAVLVRWEKAKQSNQNK